MNVKHVPVPCVFWNRLINHKTVKKLMDELELKSEVRKVK